MDTLKYVKRLEAAGVSRKQAETQVEIMADIVVSNFATKADMTELRTELQRDMVELRTELKHEMDLLRLDMRELRTELKRDMVELRTELKSDMQNLNNQMTIRLGGMMVVGIGVVAAISKL